MPQVDLEKVRTRRNPYAERIVAEGITLQVGRGRPKRGAEVGPTVPKSVRLPEQVWERLAERAKKEGIPLHAALRAAVLEWLNRAA
jgi:macrodomain Ter protein organizer (MatP/YcbG family)